MSGLLCIGAAVGLCVPGPTADAHPLGMYIYRDANDKLVMIFPWYNYWPIKYKIPPFEGLIDGDYPYEEALGDRPAQGLWRTHPGSKLELVAVDFAPGVYVRDPADINIAIREAGERVVIGMTGTGFLTFPWWHLDEGDPAYVPGQEGYPASFYLRDITGVHGDSDVYTFWMYEALFYCPADLTGSAAPGTPTFGVPDGVLNSEDFFYYMVRYVEQYAPVVDLTSTAIPGTPGYGVPDGIVNSDDFFYYLGLYVLGC